MTENVNGCPYEDSHGDNNPPLPPVNRCVFCEGVADANSPIAHGWIGVCRQCALEELPNMIARAGLVTEHETQDNHAELERVELLMRANFWKAASCCLQGELAQGDTDYAAVRPPF
jgi:hypothetical protein